MNSIPLCSNCDLHISVNASIHPDEDTLQSIRDGHVPSSSSRTAHTHAADAVEPQNLDRALAQLRALAAPAQRVPTELWGAIFYHACTDTTLAYPMRRSMLTALTLTHVCQRSAAIAQQDTRLWAPSLHVSVGDLLADAARAALVDGVRHFRLIVSLYLDQSRSKPISVDLSWLTLENPADAVERAEELERSEDAYLPCIKLAQNSRASNIVPSPPTSSHTCSTILAWADINHPSSRASTSAVPGAHGPRMSTHLFGRYNAPNLQRWKHVLDGFWPHLPLQHLTSLFPEAIVPKFLADILRSGGELKYLDVKMNTMEGTDWPGSENKLASLSAEDMNLARLETLVFETRDISAYLFACFAHRPCRGRT